MPVSIKGYLVIIVGMTTNSLPRTSRYTSYNEAIITGLYRIKYLYACNKSLFGDTQTVCAIGWV